uniref:Smoothelin, like n=1 Tax=Lepisosteus oculatus TaxID=7918 RepID=W5MIB1_LEPOC
SQSPTAGGSGEGPVCSLESCLAEAQAVCEALGRYETTLQDAVREIHVDISVFKQGVERRVEEALGLVSPLGRAVAELQRENRQLRGQLEALTREEQWEHGFTAEILNAGHSVGTHVPRHFKSLKNIEQKRGHREVVGGGRGSGKSFAQNWSHLSADSEALGLRSERFSQRSPATLKSKIRAIFSRCQQSQAPVSSVLSALPLASSGVLIRSVESEATTELFLCILESIDREELIDVDAAAAIGSNVVENGHQSGPGNNTEVKSPPEPAPSYAAQEHTAPVALRMPHLPITATTKTADSSVATVTKTLESPTTPVRERAPPPAGPQPEPVSQSASSSSQSVPVAESAQQSGVSCPVKTWSPSPLRTMGSPRASDKPVPLTAKQSPAVSNAPSSDRSVDGFPESSPLPRVGDRRRELVRSQTLPRTMGAQTRRAPFERLDSDPSRPKVGDSKPKLKRSQSFGVSSASSIKQILLEWCRSKTIGYQNIDIQNFSSSWSDGMAFCALVHSFFPEEFDYNALSPANRKQNFELAFSKAEERAACDRLIEVEDMLVMGRKPDPMCVFTYVQSLYNHLRREFCGT